MRTGEIEESENIRETLKESWGKNPENREIWSIKIYNQDAKLGKLHQKIKKKHQGILKKHEIVKNGL